MTSYCTHVEPIAQSEAKWCGVTCTLMILNTWCKKSPKIAVAAPNTQGGVVEAAKLNPGDQEGITSIESNGVLKKVLKDAKVGLASMHGLPALMHSFMYGATRSTTARCIPSNWAWKSSRAISLRGTLSPSLLTVGSAATRCWCTA